MGEKRFKNNTGLSCIIEKDFLYLSIIKGYVCRRTTLKTTS